MKPTVAARFSRLGLSFRLKPPSFRVQPELINRRARVARYTVLIAASLFVLCQLAAAWLIESDRWPIADPIFSEKIELLRRQSNFFEASVCERRLIALGSSRTQLGFDAKQFHVGLPGWHAFNFGTPGGGPITNRLYWHRLRQEGLQADVVLVEVHPALWGPSAQGASSPYEARWLQPYRLRNGEPELLGQANWVLPTPGHLTWFGKLTTTANYRLGLLNRHFPNLMPTRHGLTVGSKMDEHGFVSGINIPAKDRPRALARARAEYADAFCASEICPVVRLNVRLLLAEIQASGAKPLLVVLPEQQEFQSWYGPQHPKLLAECLAGLQREFNIGCIDGRDFVDEEHFVDGHHLTRTGATQFTQKFREAFQEWLSLEERP